MKNGTLTREFTISYKPYFRKSTVVSTAEVHNSVTTLLIRSHSDILRHKKPLMPVIRIIC